MGTNEKYNERRKRPVHCSSCGKYIGLITPRYCDRCKVRQESINKNARYVKKGRPKTNKLKVYKKPKESWRLYLYHQYKLHGIKELSMIIGIYERSLLNHIFIGVNPLNDYIIKYIDYFRKVGREDLATDVHLLREKDKVH